ncbi:hypothetical protein W97_06205 [Coniosporium apollinis CBS 100218]|uniref:DUF3429 domain-containing protein n=1 Tax=Coniosporium apollinis (strain CBS 100218) TaxID=1168221 RepID=R7YY68_CONA1|nr:uncharacterized protein W97_06205 [Coniosporium apollinis CBS 100218]EON66803.1 hypothetical protein W97_06205 [Coniosporium apollinis CBS 100218]
MLRTGAARAVLRTLNTSTFQPVRSSFNGAATKVQFTSKLCTSSYKRPQALAIAARKPVTACLVRQATTQTQWDKPDKKHEKEVGKHELEATPDIVSSTSSVHPVFSEVATPEPEREVDMMAGVKSDLRTIRDTFSLADVPRQAYILGLAGTLPYLATSLSTVYCAWEINHASATGTGLLMSQHNAEMLLHLLEPLQIGWGAVIISFLGAIHWGLEWAGYGGYQGYRRYAIGVVAPAIAWPTVLLPAEYALIAQFLAFNFLYYADARATVRGWTPSWYGTYRFVLTFIVGAAIVISLVGRGQIADRVGKLPSPMDRVKAFKNEAEMALAEEEHSRVAKKARKNEGVDE